MQNHKILHLMFVKFKRVINRAGRFLLLVQIPIKNNTIIIKVMQLQVTYKIHYQFENGSV